VVIKVYCEKLKQFALYYQVKMYKDIIILVFKQILRFLKCSKHKFHSLIESHTGFSINIFSLKISHILCANQFLLMF